VTAVVTTGAELAVTRAQLAGQVAVVMTMGALHDGHLRLIEVARGRADAVIVTIFVNPLQFGPGEDLDRYPRTLVADLALCRAEGVDVVFAPSVEEIYPPGEPIDYVSAGALGQRLEGTVRPTHFDGVLTVVAKLFGLVQADVAVFGEKDAQQLALIRRMVKDRQIPVEVVGVPIVREPDGLALSSRNRYLDASHRELALALSQSLREGAGVASDGPAAVMAAARARLAATPAIDVDYVELVDERTWEYPSETTHEARILVAGRVGSTRLIDNTPIVLGTQLPAG
jgi:pantoate--beta-alanine ligase